MNMLPKNFLHQNIKKNILRSLKLFLKIQKLKKNSPSLKIDICFVNNSVIL